MSTKESSEFLVRGLGPYADRIDAWIEKEFAGYGMAGTFAESIRGGSGPAMSMADAKQLTRVAVLTFLLMQDAHR